MANILLQKLHNVVQQQKKTTQKKLNLRKSNERFSSVSLSSSLSSPPASISTTFNGFVCNRGKNNSRQISAMNLMIFLKIINLIRILPIVKRSSLNLNLSNNQCSSRGALWITGNFCGDGP